MLPLIQQAAMLGYTAKQILDYVSGKIKGVASGVQNSRQQGYSDEDILKFLSGKVKSKGAEKQLSDNEQYLKNAGFKTKGERQETRNKSIKTAFQLGGTALGAYALSRALPRASSALQGQLLPAQTNAPMGQGNQLPGPQQTINVTPKTNAPNIALAQLPAQSNAQQTQPQPQSVQPNIAPPVKQTPLPEALHNQTLNMLQGGTPIEKVSQALKSLQPKIVKEYEKATGQPIDGAVQDFASSYLPPPPKGKLAPVSTPVMEKGLQPQEQQIEPTAQPIQEKPDERFKNVIEEGRKKFDEHMSAQPVPEPTAYMTKKEKGSTVALPSGDIGEIIDIRQGIATVNANGKEFRRKVEDLEEEPEGIDEIAKKMVELIPEGEKSTAFQESIHLNIPVGENQIGVMVTKYYGGKWAWYADVSNEDYSRIAQGTFEPKTEGKTGIAEYKPGVIDSRGSGNQQLIIQNPKYSKANKGITWDYADTKYNLTKSMDAALLKLSKQRKDEKGNVIEKRKKPTGKSSDNIRLSEPQSEKTEEKISEVKEPTKLREITKESAKFSGKKNPKNLLEKMKLEKDFSKELKKIEEPARKSEKPEITPKKLKEQKSYILGKLSEALSNPTDDDYINIHVPGDGNFKIVNLKEALEKFQERVEKKWPTAPLKSNEPKSYKR